MNNLGKFIMTGIVSIVLLFVMIYFGVSFFSGSNQNSKITDKNKAEVLSNMYADVSVSKTTPTKGQIDLNPADLASELPDISKFPITIKNNTNDFVEIFSSTEKTGSGNDGWLNEVANDFNSSNIVVNGQHVSVKIRSIASGTATDYITSGKYVPDAFSPSNELWGEMVKASGVKANLVSKRIAGNVPGIVIKKTKYDEMLKKYGKVDIQIVTNAMEKNEFAMGYTDPFASSTGLNFLITSLNTFDNKNPLSEKATKEFEKFQNNVPFTASTTLQMREAAKSGSLDGFVLEYQSYVNMPDIKGSYKFIPFGVRHDSPLYALGNISDEKLAIIQKFSDFALQSKYQDAAQKDGFNYLNDYKPNMEIPDGSTLAAAQKLWKEKKNGTKQIDAVFIADVSGSMDGVPLNALKKSLIQGQKYLGRDNAIGLVSYSDDVTINLPIAKYDVNQQSKFVGAVNSLEAGGNTATNDAIIVAIKMLQDKMKAEPNVRPLIFVLTDGGTNKGHELDEIRGIIKAYKIPIYTIGYNAASGMKSLQEISGMNEAATINADTDNVVYQIRNLLNVQM